MYRAIGFDKRNENYPQLTDHYFTGDYPVKPIDELGDNKITQLEIEKSDLDYLIKLSSEMINLLSQKEDFDRERAKMSLRTDEPFKKYWEFIEGKI